ncbi:MAG: hypothetical protein ACI3ZG_00130, partial [Candidatus Coprenecus sp.]
MERLMIKLKLIALTSITLIPSKPHIFVNGLQRISVSNEVWSNGIVKSNKYTNSKGLSWLEINSTISKIVRHFGQY